MEPYTSVGELYAAYYPNGTPPDVSNETCLETSSSVPTEVVAAFACVYPLIFMTAVTGNILVLFVVLSNREMQTVTNIFIANLAASDLLVSFTSLWLTPVYIFLEKWIWGRPLCYGFPLFQGIATYNSTFTLLAIALDRYVVILHPLRARISKSVSVAVIGSIWTLSLFLTFPYAVHMVILYPNAIRAANGRSLFCSDQQICSEHWPWEGMRTIYGTVALCLQFLFPFLVSAVCYTLIWLRIANRGGIAQVSNSDAEALRRRRLLKMLIAMVVIFALCWMPVNCLNIYRDLDFPADNGFVKANFTFFFLGAHVICMTATCWNPILFAWMNENFQREFKAVLPCFPQHRGRLARPYSIRQPSKGKANGTSLGTSNGPLSDVQRRPATLRGIVVAEEDGERANLILRNGDRPAPLELSGARNGSFVLSPAADGHTEDVCL